MDEKEANFYAQLLETFKIEAEEHLQNLSEGLMKLESLKEGDEGYFSIVEVIFREAHSLKGAARAVNLMSIQGLCQSFENVMAGLKQKTLSHSRQLFKVLYQAIDVLSEYVHRCSAEPQEEHSAPFTAISGELDRLSQKDETRSASNLQEEQPSPNRHVSAAVQKEISSVKTIRIATSKLDRLLQESEEMLLVKLNSAQRLRDLNSLQGSLETQLEEMEHWKSELYMLMQPVKSYFQPIATSGFPQFQSKFESFFDRQEIFFKNIDERLHLLKKDATQDAHLFGGIVDSLLEDLKRVLMQPFSSLTDAFPRMVRELAMSLGKEVQLKLQGGEIEIDRRILEEIKDPIIHLIRNCIDHGIELPKDREKLNKPPFGTITIEAMQMSGNFVQIFVSDDGGGIDHEKVKTAAVKLGMIKQGEAKGLKPKEIEALLFQSGLSTSPIITDLSGRGLGLGIVAEKAEKLGGQVSLETSEKVGTTFKLVLPLTMAAFRGVQVRVGESHYIIPTANVRRVVQKRVSEIKSVENCETINLDGQILPVVQLSRILGTSTPPEADIEMVLVVLGALNITMALRVDEVVSEQEIFVKGLGRQLSHVKNVAAATITERGTVIPVLDPFDLVKSAMESSPPILESSINRPKRGTERKSILVVEDSITSRILLKNILESAGYFVTTAVDGSEAYSMLKSNKVDLVVSDIEMPLMNGFELTKKMRLDRRLAEVPVILCTTRGSKEDREHGIEVGANAYIDKNSFDQGNLLDLIQQFI